MQQSEAPMFKMLVYPILMSVVTISAQADVLPPKAADKICRDKALKAAHFIAESSKRFIVSYVASNVAEISTPITYDFTYQSAKNAGIEDSLFTVHAYAYPDGSCLVGSITNNVAGND
jgi:hypothetical protein